MSALLGGGPHYARHGFGHLLPLGFFDKELVSAFFSQAVVLELPIPVRSYLPLGDNPSSFLQPMQSRIERTVLHLQEFVCGSLNMLADLMSVGGAMEKGSQDEHVERTLQKAISGLILFCHGRRSTLNVR
jgi:hypothetical protein